LKIAAGVAPTRKEENKTFNGERTRDEREGPIEEKEKQKGIHVRGKVSGKVLRLSSSAGGRKSEPWRKAKRGGKWGSSLLADNPETHARQSITSRVRSTSNRA